jgi:hypothetical protein
LIVNFPFLRVCLPLMGDDTGGSCLCYKVIPARALKADVENLLAAFPAVRLAANEDVFERIGCGVSAASIESVGIFGSLRKKNSKDAWRDFSYYRPPHRRNPLTLWRSLRDRKRRGRS